MSGKGKPMGTVVRLFQPPVQQSQRESPGGHIDLQRKESRKHGHFFFKFRIISNQFLMCKTSKRIGT